MVSISARPAATALLVVAGLMPPLTAGTPSSTAPSPTVVTTASDVVLNELAPSAPWPSSPFVELRNTGDQPVELDGWELVACLAPGNSQVAVVFGSGDEIAQGGYLLLVHNSFSDLGAQPDKWFDVEVPEDGGWLLFDPWSGYADGVGLGSGLDCTEGDPAPQCDWAAGESVTRDEQGRDTDDNAADFTCEPGTPGL